MVVEPVGRFATESVTHGQCGARSTVTFTATERHRSYCGFLQNHQLIIVLYYADIDECATNNGGCDDNSDCVNSAGSFTCECHAGHARDGGATCEGNS